MFFVRKISKYCTCVIYWMRSSLKLVTKDVIKKHALSFISYTRSVVQSPGLRKIKYYMVLYNTHSNIIPEF